MGRERECSQIDDLLQGSGLGRGGTIALIGEPGIGKTALISYAREKALGIRTVAAKGHEATRGAPFGHLDNFVAPLQSFIATLAPPHQRAFEVALNPSGEVISNAPDRHAVGIALLELFAAAATAEPLLVLVDDAHWVDVSTAGALAFAARRLTADPVAIIIALRPDEETPLLSGMPPPLIVGGIQDADAIQLLDSQVSAKVAVELARATGGNPLAMLNAVDQLSEEQRRGQHDLAFPVAVGEDLEKALARRLSAKDKSVMLLMLMIAAEGPTEIALLSAAAGLLDIDFRLAFDDAISSGFIHASHTRVDFRHPLLRSAVYHRAAPQDRQAVHAAWAGVFRRDVDLSRRARHLAAASSSPDEGTAAAIEMAAESARDRCAYAEAGMGYTRAAEFSPSSVDRIRRTLAGVDAHHRAGQTKRALELIEIALEATDDPLVQADILVKRMDFVVQTGGSITDLTALMAGTAGTIGHQDPLRAAALWVSLSLPAMTQGRADLMESAIGRALELSAGTPFADVARLLLHLAHMHSGKESKCLPALREFGLKALESAPAPEASMLEPMVALALAWGDQLDLAQSLLAMLVTNFRSASMLANLPQLLTNRAWVHFWRGDWPAALADGAEARQLAEESQQLTLAHYARLVIAAVEAGQGTDLAQDHAEDLLAPFGAMGAAGFESWTHGILGLSEQGLGRPEQAVGHFELAESLVLAGGPVHPLITSSAPELVEAHFRTGDQVAAERWLEIAIKRADDTGNATVQAQAWRCRGLLASKGDVDRAFSEALSWHDRSPRPFERARTEICYGERLRRARRVGDAVHHLKMAKEIFLRLGAASWQERCDNELRACGEPTGRPVTSWLRALSPQELNVTLAVAGGATNREAATTLFISPRTVEFHLASVFRKLHVRSRAELARKIALASEGELG